ncbi:8655_t:CDS:2 [Funneliformis geosporum]|nr:8655_t:CDS:2 [Funneliformis geosporum]
MDYNEYTFENSSIVSVKSSEALSGYQSVESLVTEDASAFEEDETDLTQEECWEVVYSFSKKKASYDNNWTHLRTY